MGHRKQAKI
ncbi:uncharacterized protein FFB14_04976 [Fusarium fujikuroi]|nr:uncharacterized protein FFB14_04976 [Fusarium fujikuroi]